MFHNKLMVNEKIVIHIVPLVQSSLTNQKSSLKNSVVLTVGFSVFLSHAVKSLSAVLT